MWQIGPIYIELSPVPIGQILQIIAVLAALILTLIQLQRNIKTNQISNLLAVTKNHREVWSEMLGNAELAQILDPNIDIQTIDELSRDQRLLINFILLHMAASDTALRHRALTRNPNVKADIGQLMSLPAFQVAWVTMKKFHLERFVRLVDRSVAETSRPRGRRSARRK